MTAPALALATAVLVVLDDGERVARDRDHALAPSPWPAEVSLFAMRGETVAIQAVVESRERLHGVHATVGDFSSRDGVAVAPVVETWAEHFVNVVRPSGNEHGPGSLASTDEAAPDPRSVVGFFADALVPGDADLADGDRAAIWIDLTVPAATSPGDYASTLYVSSARGAIDTRRITLRVLDRDMPWAAAKTMIYYEPKNLERRMGDRAAEIELRQLLHAHHVSAVHDVRSTRDMTLDLDALSGELFTTGRGYEGPGAGVGEGVFAIGAYGSLGPPSPAGRADVVEITDRLRARGYMENTCIFVYAVDEACASAWPAGWRTLFRGDDALRGVRVGATCGDDPTTQAANLVMMTAPDYAPSLVRAAREAGKWVWAYNGQRPYAGPMMLDAPAVDLRANAWIAARYDVERWFYWESTYWLDDNHGGEGGWEGFDPFAVAETFHNADGDYANGDGILVYPGTQVGARGMRDFGMRTVFPSVRLKNLRRGVEDAAYIEAAREVDREAADEIVRRVVPRALGQATKRASWPDRGAAFLDARRNLVRVLDRAPSGTPSRGAPAESSRAGATRIAFAAAAAALLVVFAVRRARHSRNGA